MTLGPVPDELKPLRVSRECEEDRHHYCLGSSRLVRQHPNGRASGYQPMPCLCACHHPWERRT